MIDATTPLGRLIEVAKLLEAEHGPFQGIVLHRNGVGRVIYNWKTFNIDLATLDPNPSIAPAVPASSIVNPQS